MSDIDDSTTSTPPSGRSLPPFKYRNLLQGNFGDWRDQLREDGYCVLPGVIPRDKALEYRQRAFDWLEGWQYNGGAFDRNDPATFKQDNMPLFQRQVPV